jgi:hypothetical protein
MGSLLRLVRKHRQALVDEVEEMTDAQRLLWFLKFMERVVCDSGSMPEFDRTAFARALALDFKFGSGIDEAVELLHEAGVGDFAAEDLKNVRYHRSFQPFRNALHGTSGHGWKDPRKENRFDARAIGERAVIQNLLETVALGIEAGSASAIVERSRN